MVIKPSSCTSVLTVMDYRFAPVFEKVDDEFKGVGIHDLLSPSQTLKPPVQIYRCHGLVSVGNVQDVFEESRDLSEQQAPAAKLIQEKLENVAIFARFTKGFLDRV
jgi:hypothetical protein